MAIEVIMTIMVHVRVCRECGEEYRPEVVRCADCGGALEDRFEEEGAMSPLPGVLPAPVAEPLGVAGHSQRIFSSDRAAEVEPLAARLGAAGIPFSVQGSMTGFELLVSEADLERAARELGVEVPSVDADAADATALAVCPACGAALPADATDCPDCGLAVGAPKDES